MNNAVVSAFAAVGGSAVGAFAPVLSNFILQRTAAQREFLAKEMAQKETLYSDFIHEASSLYAKAFVQHLDNFQELVSLSALESRIRLSSSPEVSQAAEDLLKQIITQFGEPNISVEELRSAALATKARPLTIFSDICRKELQLLAHGALSFRKVNFSN